MPPVVVGLCIIWFQTDSFGEVCNGSAMVFKVPLCKSPVIVGFCIVWFQWTLPHLVDTEKSQYLPEKENWHGCRQEA